MCINHNVPIRRNMLTLVLVWWTHLYSKLHYDVQVYYFYYETLFSICIVAFKMTVMIDESHIIVYDGSFQPKRFCFQSGRTIMISIIRSSIWFGIFSMKFWIIVVFSIDHWFVLMQTWPFLHFFHGVFIYFRKMLEKF